MSHSKLLYMFRTILNAMDPLSNLWAAQPPEVMIALHSDTATYCLLTTEIFVNFTNDLLPINSPNKITYN